MKAILRSINNFSCKLKQSNNLKYNISPKIRSNKFKSISGNCNIVIEDALGKNLKNYRIDGNTYQNSTSGQQLYDYLNPISKHNAYTLLSDGWVEFYMDRRNTTGSSWQNYFVAPMNLKPDTEYAIVIECQETSENFTFTLCQGRTDEQFSSTLGGLNMHPGITIYKLTTKSDFSNVSVGLRLFTAIYSKVICSAKFRISVIEDTSITADTFEYESYTNGASPNPNYPQEIVSCGDKTKNMITGLNKSTTNYINFYFDKDMATQNMTLSGIFSYSVSDFSIFLQTSFDNELLLNFQSCTQNEKFSFDIQLTDTQLENIVNSTTTPSIQFYRTGAMSGIGYSEIMLRASDTTAEYEPYGKYKIPVNVRSDNLLNVSNVRKTEQQGITTTYNDDGSLHISGTTNSNYVNLTDVTQQTFEPGTYTFSIKPLDTRNFTIRLRLNYDDSTNDTLTIPLESDSISITTTKTIISHFIYLGGFGDQTLTLNTDLYLKLEKGPIATPYQPYYNETTNIYLNEPLRKIGEYSDYIDFINGKAVRKIRKIILDGSENWARSYGNNLFNMQHYLDDAMFIVGYGLSNYYRYNPVQSGINANTKNGEFALQSSYGGNVMIKNTDYTVINDFKTWLSTHNTEILYPLATPTEEDIELPNINLIEGKNIITIGTELESIIEVEYYSKEIIDISDYKYNLRKVED